MRNCCQLVAWEIRVCGDVYSLPVAYTQFADKFGRVLGLACFSGSSTSDQANAGLAVAVCSLAIASFTSGLNGTETRFWDGRCWLLVLDLGPAKNSPGFEKVAKQQHEHIIRGPSGVHPVRHPAWEQVALACLTLFFR